MPFDATAYDDASEAFYATAKQLLRKNASENETKQIERECDLLNRYNELILLTEQVLGTNDKELIATIQKRTYEANDKLDECSEVLRVKINVPDNITDLISFQNPDRSTLQLNDNPEVHYSLSEWIDRQYALHTKGDTTNTIVPNKTDSKTEIDSNKTNHSDIVPKTVVIPKPHIPNHTMDPGAFASLMAANIRNNFAGDPLKLAPFLASIEFLKEMATTETLKTLLRKFVLTKLEGYASEIIAEDVATIDDIISGLKKGIKPESSKVIEGRMMALRSNKTNLQDFSKQVEDLADALRRALISAKIPREVAEAEVIEKTVDLCRANTDNMTVKSVLASRVFTNPKDVVAKFITESNKTRQESQILSLRQFRNGNSRGRFHAKSGQQRGNHFNGRFANSGNRQYNNNNNGNNNNNNSNRQNQNNGSPQGGFNRSRSGNYRNANRGGTQNRNIRVVENSTATQSTLGAAEE